MAQIDREYSGTAIRIITPCVVNAFGYKKTSYEKEKLACDSALWDTGAAVSVISSRVASELHLIPTGMSFVSGFDGKRVKRNTYRIDLEFTDEIRVGFVEVVESPMVIFDLLIGMDIISQGNLRIENINNHGTKFDFEM